MERTGKIITLVTTYTLLFLGIVIPDGHLLAAAAILAVQSALSPLRSLERPEPKSKHRT